MVTKPVVRVSDETILTALVEASVAEKTMADVAAATGMKISALNQRLCSLRKIVGPLPTLKRQSVSGDSRKKNPETLKALLATIQAAHASKTEKAPS